MRTGSGADVDLALTYVHTSIPSHGFFLVTSTQASGDSWYGSRDATYNADGRRPDERWRRVPQPVGDLGVQGARQGRLGRRERAVVRGPDRRTGNFFNTAEHPAQAGGRRGGRDRHRQQQERLQRPEHRHHPARVLGSAAALRYNEAVSLRAALDAMFATLPAQLVASGSGGAVVPRDQRRLRCRDRATRFAEARARASRAAGARRDRRLGAPRAGAVSPTSTSSCCTTSDEASAKQVADRLLYPLWDEKLAIGHAIREATRGRAAGPRRSRDRDRAARRAPHRRRSPRCRPSSCARRSARSRPAATRTSFIAMLAAEQKGAPRSVRRVALPARAEPQAGHRRAARSGDRAVGGAGALASAAAGRAIPRRAEALIGDLVAMGHLTRRQGDVLVECARLHAAHPRARPAHGEAPLRSADVRDPGGDRAERCIPTRGAHEGDIRPRGRAGGRGADARLLPARARGRAGRRSPARVRARAGAQEAADRAGRRQLHHVQRRARDQGSAAVRRAAERDDAAVPRRGRRAAAGLRPHPRARSPRRSRAIRRRSRRSGRGAPVPRRARRSARRRAAVGARGHAPARHPVGDDAGVGAVHRPRPARPLSRLHRRPAPALRASRCRSGSRAASSPRSIRSRPSCGSEVTRPAPLLPRHAAPRRRQAARQGPRREGRGRRGAVARRLGMTDADVELAEFLVRQHLTMSHLSQRRDLSDPEVIARFAEQVGDDEQLVAAVPAHAVRHRDDRARQPDGVEGRACCASCTLRTRDALPRRRRRRRRPTARAHDRAKARPDRRATATACEPRPRARRSTASIRACSRS